MIDLRDYVQSRPKMINGPFYTYRRILHSRKTKPYDINHKN